MKLNGILQIRYPIVQAPMAGSDNPEFVAAACNAGILGCLGAQYRSPEEIKVAIAKIRSLTDKPFAINLFSLAPITPPTDRQIECALAELEVYYQQFDIPMPTPESVRTVVDPEEQLQVVLSERVPIFSFTLGVPSKDWIARFKAQGILLCGTATSVAEARELEDADVDLITAQGMEAGGHRGTFIGDYAKSMVGGLALVPQVVDAVKVPVVAAGGIMDGRGIAAALALGAQGVQMGTAFLTVSECPVHQEIKSIIRSSGAHRTTITKVFSGGAARGIENAFTVQNEGKPLLPFPYHNALTRPIRKVANQTGQIDYTNLWSGQAGSLAREVSIAELVQMLVDETDCAVRNLQLLRDR